MVCHGFNKDLWYLTCIMRSWHSYDVIMTSYHMLSRTIWCIQSECACNLQVFVLQYIFEYTGLICVPLNSMSVKTSIYLSYLNIKLCVPGSQKFAKPFCTGSHFENQDGVQGSDAITCVMFSYEREHKNKSVCKCSHFLHNLNFFP